MAVDSSFISLAPICFERSPDAIQFCDSRYRLLMRKHQRPSMAKTREEKTVNAIRRGSIGFQPCMPAISANNPNPANSAAQIKQSTAIPNEVRFRNPAISRKMNGSGRG